MFSIVTLLTSYKPTARRNSRVNVPSQKQIEMEFAFMQTDFLFEIYIWVNNIYLTFVFFFVGGGSLICFPLE